MSNSTDTKNAYKWARKAVYLPEIGRGEGGDYWTALSKPGCKDKSRLHGNSGRGARPRQAGSNKNHRPGRPGATKLAGWKWPGASWQEAGFQSLFFVPRKNYVRVLGAVKDHTNADPFQTQNNF